MITRRFARLFFSLLCASLLLSLPVPMAFAQQPVGTSASPANRTNRSGNALSAVSTYSDAWPMYGHDAAHTGRSPANGPNSPDIKWAWPADGYTGSPVVGTDGSIYVTVYLGSSHEELVALNPNGTVRWRLETTNGQFDYPTIGMDGKIYLVSNPLGADDWLLALNPEDGTTAWSFPLGRDSIGAGYSSFGSNSRPLVGPDGTIYKAAAFGHAGYGTIFAIHPDGTQKWTWDTSADALYCKGRTYLIYCALESSPALAPNGSLYIKPYGEGVIAINSQTGQYLWRNNFDGTSAGVDPYGQSLSVGADSVAYTSEGTGNYKFFAISPNNSVKWAAQTAGWNDQALSLISADGTLVLHADNQANFYAFNTSNGTVRWEIPQPTPGAAILGSAVLAANGLMYYTTGASSATPPGTPGYVFAVVIDTGEVLWKYEVGFPDADLAMGPDGTLYVPGESGGNPVLYAFQCADGKCDLPHPDCPDPANITTETDLNNCIQLANVVAGPQTLGLGADITLHALLPNITSEITLNGNGHFISGNNALRVFLVKFSGNLTLDTITVQNGLGETFGGGIWINSGGVGKVSNSTFTGNVVNVKNGYYVFGGGGGAINNQGTLTVVNSTFSGNTAFTSFSGITHGGKGAGIRNAGTLTVVNSTFSGNSIIDSNGQGGAIFNNGTLYLKNSILANSTGGEDCSTPAAFAANIRNIIENGFSCGTPFSKADPRLGPLADNGGPTKTIALLAGSPAVNTGDGATCAGALVNNLDQRGVKRPQGKFCDIGAFELEYVEKLNFLPAVTR